jgi:N-acetylmuramoyl-L-alanine amidase
MKFVLHHSASKKSTTIDEIDKWHKDRGFSKSYLGYHVGYHYVINGETGKVNCCRSIAEKGVHTIGHNDRIGVCITGNYETDKVSTPALNSLISILKGFNDVELKGHRDLADTVCPGADLYAVIPQVKVRLLCRGENISKDWLSVISEAICLIKNFLTKLLQRIWSQR